jgi:integrase
MKGCQPISDEDRDRVLSHMLAHNELRLLVIFTIGLCTGFRISELLSLDVGSVYDVTHSKCWGTASVRKENTKKKIEGRTHSLNTTTLKYLTDWVERLKKTKDFGPHLPLFPSTKKNKTGTKAVQRKCVYALFKILFNEIGIKFTGLHFMRKTAAKKIYDKSNKDIMMVKGFLGHKNLNSTGYYLSSMGDDSTKHIIESMF